MSLANKAARGALWTIVSSMGGRAVGVLGTLIMTRFLARDVIGEVSDATILCQSASWLTTWGFGQYAIVKGRGDPAIAAAVTWQATVFYVGLGIISLGLIGLFGGNLTSFLSAPTAAQYIPGMALAVFIRRIGAMPERVLTRQLKFRASGVALALGEMTYTAAALGFVIAGYKGMSIVYANIIQSVVVVAILVRAAGIRAWATPSRLQWDRVKDMLRYGVPLGIMANAHMASRYWDNLAISHFFDPRALGAYNMAYNLADIPAIQVGEQIALVLMPSMAELPPDRRAAALERSSALLSLVIFPLAVGLGLVAYPLIALILPHNDWQGVAPLLTVLASLSVFRPITWVLSAYLEAESKTNRLMFLELGKVVVLLGGMALLAPYGVRAASGAVGIAFGLAAIAGVAIVVREGVSPVRMLVGFLQPIAACAVMAAAVWLCERGLLLADIDHPAIVLPLEIVVGAIAYVAAALVLARKSSRDLLSLVRNALKR
jgi:lipopolysaccharide exporter